MLKDSEAFSGFAVDDLGAAQRLYGETLEQRVEMLDERKGLMTMHLPAGQPPLIYRLVQGPAGNTLSG